MMLLSFGTKATFRILAPCTHSLREAELRMTGIQSLEARTALGCVFAVAGYIAASSTWIHRTRREPSTAP